MNGGLQQAARVLADVERRMLPVLRVPTTIDPMDGDDHRVTPPHDGPGTYFPFRMTTADARLGKPVCSAPSRAHIPAAPLGKEGAATCDPAATLDDAAGDEHAPSSPAASPIGVNHG